MIDKFFTEEQMRVIFAEIDSAPLDARHIFLELIAMTGMRGCEALRVRFCDIVGTRVTIRRGGKGSDARTCELPASLVNRIKFLQDSQGLWASDTLRTSFSGKSDAGALRMLRKLLETIKARHFPGQVLPGIHGLRHTKARKAYEATNDIYFVQAVLGHKTVASTEHYMPKVDPAKLAAFQTQR